MFKKTFYLKIYEMNVVKKITNLIILLKQKYI